MKNKFLSLTLGASLFFAACGDSNTATTSTDSASVTTNNSANTQDSEANANNTSNSTGTATASTFDESASYIDLKTNKKIRFKRNQGSESLYDYETNQPYSYFFYNPATNDTFDYRGTVVNNHLTKGADGIYVIDDKNWKSKVDSDGDIKIKDHEDTKIKYDASSGQTKIKTKDTTIKVND